MHGSGSIARVGLSIGAIALLVVHVAVPDANVDAIAVGLLLAAALPWLLPLLQPAFVEHLRELGVEWDRPLPRIVVMGPRVHVPRPVRPGGQRASPGRVRNRPRRAEGVRLLRLPRPAAPHPARPRGRRSPTSPRAAPSTTQRRSSPAWRPTSRATSRTHARTSTPGRSLRRRRTRPWSSGSWPSRPAGCAGPPRSGSCARPTAPSPSTARQSRAGAPSRRAATATHSPPPSPTSAASNQPKQT